MTDVLIDNQAKKLDNDGLYSCLLVCASPSQPFLHCFFVVIYNLSRNIEKNTSGVNKMGNEIDSMCANKR